MLRCIILDIPSKKLYTAVFLVRYLVSKSFEKREFVKNYNFAFHSYQNRDTCSRA